MARSRFAKTKAQLALRIGISRPALYRLWELPHHPRPRADGSHSVEQWQSFADAHIHVWNRRGANGGNGHGPNLRDEAYIRRQEIAAERERFLLDIEQGKYALKRLVTECVLRNIGIMFRELDKAFKYELPPRLEGQSAGEIAKLNGQKLDATRERITKILQNEIASGAAATA